MTQQALLHTERHADVLVIEIAAASSPASAGALRQQLLHVLAALHSNHALQGAVLLGAGAPWLADTDAAEAAPADAPTWQHVQAAIEDTPQPVVAALQGAVLGEGWELALACDARVALAGTQLGLPYMPRGLIPVAGGAQRTARRAGLLAALPWVCGAAPVAAEQAWPQGLVDAVVPSDLLAQAVLHVRQLGGRKQRIRDEMATPVPPAQWEAAAQPWLRKGRQRPNYQAAMAALQAAATLPFAQALQQEALWLQRLRSARDVQALRYQAAAEQQAQQLPPGLQVPPRPLACMVVIGAGTMGTGIAICALDAGLQVCLLEQDTQALQRGVQRIHDHYAQRVAAGKLAPSQAQACCQALQGSLQWSALAQADVVIEAVFEDMAVKQQVFQHIDQHARAGALLATNTSYLDVDAIAAATARSQDVLGLHFFSPAQVMPLLEVVRSQHTTPQALATGMALGLRLGKLPVLCGNAFGFIGNRLYNAYRKQAEYMLEDGAWPEEVDAALRQFGFAMGPFEVADLSGLDIAWRMRQAQAATRDPRERYVPILDRLCELGRLGRKTGAGYYSYAQGQAAAAVDAQVRDIIVQASQQRGLQRRSLDSAEIVRRALMAMCNEAALLLAEGVARQPSDIDVVLVQGYGFPRWEGGPLFWSQQFDAQTLAGMQRELAGHVGHGFVPGQLALLRPADGALAAVPGADRARSATPATTTLTP